MRDTENDVKCRYIDVGVVSRWTFENRKMREWVKSWMGDRVLNSCAGETKIDHYGEIVRNDLNPDVDADFHVDAAALPIHLEPESFDTIIYDPPWSHYQSNLRYDGRHVESDDYRIDTAELPFEVPTEGKPHLGHAWLAKRGFHYLLKPGGNVIQLSYHGTNMPPQFHYIRRERVLFDPYGENKAIIAAVDEKPVPAEEADW